MRELMPSITEILGETGNAMRFLPHIYSSEKYCSEIDFKYFKIGSYFSVTLYFTLVHMITKFTLQLTIVSITKRS